MTHNIQRLAGFIMLGFVLIAASLLYWQVVRAPGLVLREDNPRLVQAELGVQRGRLLDRHEEVLAFSYPVADSPAQSGPFERYYVRPETAHVVGYYSLRYGTGGAEAAFDTTLRGQLTWLDRILHRPRVGEDVRLSVDLAAQNAADWALGDRRGAVVVLGVDSGDVLVLVSHPAYDPNRLDEDWEALSADPRAPLLNRATQGVYPVGDLARWVGLAGLLSSGITSPPDPLATPLDDMLAPLSEPGYLATARQLGLDDAPPFELPTGAGRLPDFEAQGTPRDLAATPLHMARLAAAVADAGRAPLPTLNSVTPVSPPEMIFAPRVATSLQAVTPSYDDLAGWAGVAMPQETGDQPLSWWVGYAPAAEPRYALAVVVENSDGGAATTLPIARQAVAVLQD